MSGPAGAYDGMRLDVELLAQLHEENGYCLVPIAQGKRPLDLDGDQIELVSELIRIARFGALVRTLAKATPRASADTVVREATLRLSGLMKPGRPPSRKD